MENSISLGDFENNIFNLNFYIQERKWFKIGECYFKASFSIVSEEDSFNNSQIIYAFKNTLTVNILSFANATNFKIRSKNDFLKLCKYLLEIIKGVASTFYHDIIFSYRYNYRVYVSNYKLTYDKSKYFNLSNEYYTNDKEDENTQIRKFKKIGTIIGSLQQPAKTVIGSLQAPYQNLINQLINK